MADDTQVIPQDFTPEPIPDSIADTELNGLDPAQDSTESEQVETEQEATTHEEADDSTKVEEEAEAGTPSDTEAETNEEAVAPSTEKTDQTEAMTGAERRLAEKAQRNYVQEERQKIRDYEQQADPSDVEERMKILEAKQYVDTVERNRSDLINDSQRAQSQIDLFNPEKPEYSEKLYTRALQRFNDNYVVTDDETGEVLGAQDRNGNPVYLFQYLQQEAQDMSEILGNTKASSRAEAQKAEAKMRAKAVNPSNPGKVTSSGDELDDLLDRIGDTPMF